jgi:serine/threonine-protein kinase
VRDPPFNADSPLALLAAVVSDPLPSVREKRPDVPPQLEAVIAKCLEKNPDNRYQTVAELADALAPFAPRSMPSVSRISGILRSASMRPLPADKSPSSERTLQSPGTPITGDQPTEEVRVQVVTPAPATRGEKSTHTDWEASPSSAQRSRRRVAVMAIIAVVALIAGALIWQRQRPVTAEPAPDPSTLKSSARAAALSESSPPRAAPSVAEVPGNVPILAAPAVSLLPSPSAAGKVKTKPLTAPASTPSVAAPAPVLPKPAPAADPLDGRR